MGSNKPSFGGWATKYDVLCSDGLTIKPGAFSHNNQKKVPLMWNHLHSDPTNVLGHAILEEREDGVYARGFFNDTERAQIARQLISHGDINSMSIHAKKLRSEGMDVFLGDIHEVSLVMSRANPEAFIDFIDIKHSDGDEVEGIIYSGELIEHSEGDDTMADQEKDKPEDKSEEKKSDDLTVEEVLDTFTTDQLTVMEYFVSKALEEGDKEEAGEEEEVEEEIKQSSEDEDTLSHSKQTQEGIDNMSRNVFDQTHGSPKGKQTLTHAQFETLVTDAKRMGSLREAFLTHMDDFGVTEKDIIQHADADYGIENVGFLFPEAQLSSATPEFIQRDSSWADVFLSRTKKLPFSRVRSIVADITAEEARARGYITGNLKKEEVFPLLRRTTTPTTVYKKQKLDRDNLVDITSMDVVVWLKAEMRIMLNEEVARAGLLGDGRSVADEDHIEDPKGQNSGAGIRSIANDNDMYAHKVTVPSSLANGVLVERVLRSWSKYRGSGNTTLYTTNEVITDMLLEKDKVGRRLYATVEELASVLRVKRIQEVEAMTAYPELVGIIVDESDYAFGSTKGGEVSLFDDFDLNYNQMLYLMETRLSGALTKPKSALVFIRTLDNEVVPTMPAFDTDTNTITIPTITGVEYLIDDEVATGSIIIEEDTEVAAYPTTGYMFPLGVTTSWNYTYVAEVDEE